MCLVQTLILPLLDEFQCLLPIGFHQSQEVSIEIEKKDCLYADDLIEYAHDFESLNDWCSGKSAKSVMAIRDLSSSHLMNVR
jgi:hypothetical protein